MQRGRQKGSLIDRIQASIEKAAEALESMASNLERLTDAVLQAALRCLDRTYQWLVRAVKYVKEYLIRIGKALIRIVVVGFKLLLFYMPGVIFIALYFPTEWTILLIVGCLWVLLISALVLTSKGKPNANK